jgi:putative mRNA 3-end processing factor
MSAGFSWIRAEPHGIHIRPADCWIDPSRPVERALVTHGHADHARGGHGQTIATPATLAIMELRYQTREGATPVAYGETIRLPGGVDATYIPAGHVLGSAQILLEHAGERVVVTGDYKRVADPTCPPFEVTPCDIFITEATFGLPVFCHPPVAEEIGKLSNALADHPERCVLVGAYALGKAQRLIASLAPHLDEPMLAHGAVVAACDAYRDAGVTLPAVTYVDDTMRGSRMDGRVVMAPPSALGSPWMKRFPRASVAMVSGWMRVRGRRRWKGVDRGFVLSDHADWPGLLATIAATGARRVLTMHGYADVLARHLREQGMDAAALEVPSTVPS